MSKVALIGNFFKDKKLAIVDILQKEAKFGRKYVGVEFNSGYIVISKKQADSLKRGGEK